MPRRITRPRPQPVDSLTEEQRERLHALVAAVPRDALPKTSEVLALRAVLLDLIGTLPADSFLRARLVNSHNRLRAEGTVDHGVALLAAALEASA